MKNWPAGGESVAAGCSDSDRWILWTPLFSGGNGLRRWSDPVSVGTMPAGLGESRFWNFGSTGDSKIVSSAPEPPSSLTGSEAIESFEKFRTLRPAFTAVTWNELSLKIRRRGGDEGTSPLQHLFGLALLRHEDDQLREE